VIWGGSNDIGKNNCKGALKELCDFVKNNRKVKTIIVTAPPRFYLLPTSCVNNEVINFNRQLKKKRIAPYNKVKVLETGLERGYFTNHGLHLNSSGKECIARKPAEIVTSSLKKEKVTLPVYPGKTTPLSPIEMETSPIHPVTLHWNTLNHIFP